MTIENIKIAIDRGGTFTDVIAIIPGQEDYVFKLLSVDPSNYKDANIEGIRRVLEFVHKKPIPRGEPLDTSCISSIKLGTTVATNALLERKGEKIAFLTTKGFKDYLYIGDQSRPDLFSLKIIKPGVLYEKVVELDERVTLAAYTEDPNHDDCSSKVNGKDFVLGATKEVIHVIKPLDVNEVKTELTKLKEEGFITIAICFMHGYNYRLHEIKVKELAESMGFTALTSHETLATIKAIPRGQSTVVDAYLTPVIKLYIKNFLSGFKSGFENHTRIEFMQSDGGLSSHEHFSGLRSLLSGPAGGVVGAAVTCYDEKEKSPIVGFDMGGTSTDVSRFAGQYEHVFETLTAGINVAAPQLDINTVAAGGGSILFYENGVLRVGPDSASSHPGPACYRKGGPLTVTDANLFTGRILPEYFPKIFGPNENLPLDHDITKKKFEELTEQINNDNPENPKTPYEVALGFLKVANFNMAKPIRSLTESKGYDVARHTLASFGGAGGQHAASLAQILKINRVIIHKYSSILSAYGIALADVVKDEQEPSAGIYSEETKTELLKRCEVIKKKVTDGLLAQGCDPKSLKYEIFFNMGYTGSETKLMIKMPENGDFLSEFLSTHEREFSFNDGTRDINIHDIRVRGSSVVSKNDVSSPYDDLAAITEIEDVEKYAETKKMMVFEEGELESKVFFLSQLPVGSIVKGPALILDATQTILVTPTATATILPKHVILNLKTDLRSEVSTDYVDPIQVAVFSNRFMFIAEDMGRTLRKISVSANIKERMDFSCALFDQDGNLTANAPHVPVHLGSMSFSIKYAKEYWGDNIKPGDVLATNHPIAGGTHLPDITLISPVFIDGKIRFFTASRAHHAEIGGTAPGSSPSDAKHLWEEGASFVAWKIVSQGKFDYDGVNKYFIIEPAKYPRSSSTRKLQDNITDLKAQIAANQRGVNLLQDLFEEYGVETVLFYMSNVKKSAEVAVRNFLKKFAKERRGQLPLKSEEYLDDGSRLCCSIDINEEDGTAVYDFTGTSEQAYNCYNAPSAVTHACVIYGLRTLINADIPLNEGCLVPIKIIIPEGTILNPTKEAAVNAGNSNTSQRINDTIMKAYGVCGAGTGSMNLLAFGMGGMEDGKLVEGFGMVETIGGGSGACEGCDGWSGTQVHMTNTKITDPEILEKRYPCILLDFSIRKGTGGKGQWRGGDGMQRTVEFTKDLHCSVAAYRRVNAPYGMAGGEDGARGQTRLGKKKPDGSVQWIHLPGFCEIDINAGDIVCVRTPGGGGFGSINDGLTFDTSRKPLIPATVAPVPLAGGTLANLSSIAASSQ